MLGAIKSLMRRREINRLERTFPNPRSAAPRGRLEPHKRQSYMVQVFQIAVVRLVILACLITLAFWFAENSGQFASS